VAKEEARREIQDLRKKVLEDGADFAAIAREFSEDAASKDRGGEIVIRRGQTLTAFEETAFRLEPGTVSEIVETPSGFHIIKLHERIPGRVASYEEVESMIQEVLDQRELQKLIKAEIKELRAKAKVQVFI
jgi:parvulin-like peptidyl-prolyl isomerase